MGFYFLMVLFGLAGWLVGWLAGWLGRGKLQSHGVSTALVTHIPEDEGPFCGNGVIYG